MQNAYDLVPYPSGAYAPSHPDRLATLALLMGLSPAPVESCRVLELGCASGGNLIPIAHALRGSRFLGIDLSGQQVLAGQRSVEALGLDNVELRCLDLRDVTPELGEFDYVIAHGVYSWVDHDVQDKILRICKQNLAASGVAYVSYNTYPGWHMMRILRDAMLYHARNETSADGRAAQARAMLSMIGSAAASNDRYGNILKAYVGLAEEASRLLEQREDASLLHDELEAVNDPVYFHEFARRAEERGLQFVVEADIASSYFDALPAETRQMLHASGRTVVEKEQYLDFLRNRTFRQTLLCHAGRTVERVLRTEAIADLHVRSRARRAPERDEDRGSARQRYVSPDRLEYATENPLVQAAMDHLLRVAPRAVPFRELLAAARAGRGDASSPAQDAALGEDGSLLAASLLRGFCSSTHLVGLHSAPAQLASAPGERPEASPIARLQAREQHLVTNLWHEAIKLDAFVRFALQRLDGQRDRGVLTEELVELARKGDLVFWRNDARVTEEPAIRDIVTRNLEPCLAGLAASALLVG